MECPCYCTGEYLFLATVPSLDETGLTLNERDQNVLVQFVQVRVAARGVDKSEQISIFLVSKKTLFKLQALFSLKSLLMDTNLSVGVLDDLQEIVLDLVARGVVFGFFWKFLRNSHRNGGAQVVIRQVIVSLGQRKNRIGHIRKKWSPLRDK